MQLRFWFIVIVLIVFIFGGLYFRGQNQRESTTDSTEKNSFDSLFPDESTSLELPEDSSSISDSDDAPRVAVFASGLEIPWAIAFLPEGGMLVTERAGTVRFVSPDGKVKPDPVAVLNSVKHIGEGGLQGIALHPNFDQNHYVYLYYTYAGDTNKTQNRVSRFTYDGKALQNETVIIDAIPGAANHDGGRIKFGPDGYLYITTVDAQNPSQAQETDSLAGKILRVTDDGSSVSDNPFGNRVYSYGHRNPQGITWDDQGQLWQTEHGPSGVETGNDEFNRIIAGVNYGWPLVRGMQAQSGLETPIIESGSSDTWAPAGLAFVNGGFYFAGLRGAALYKIAVNGTHATLETYLKNEYGRLREVILGPDGLLYVTTSNRDGRGNPQSGDDKILRINPEKL